MIAHFPISSGWRYFLLNKTQLRKTLREARKKITLSRRHSAAVAAANAFVADTLFATSQHIACYLARADEFDTQPLIDAIWQAGKICYLPVVSTQSATPLVFVAYQKTDHLIVNQFHILEPNPTPEKCIAAEQLELVFVPLLAFDSQGHRLGSGGGYYDKTFAFLREKSRQKPRLIGLGYQEQKRDSLPHDAWDLELDGVLTEQGLNESVR